MKMGLFTSAVVCIFVCVLFIKLSSVDARCWIHCPTLQYSELEPFCFINDEEGDSECFKSVSNTDLTELPSQDWKKVNLILNITNIEKLTLINELPDYGLELRAFKDVYQVTYLRVGLNNMIISHYVLYRFQNLRYVHCSGVAFAHFPHFSINNQLTYLGLHDYTIISNYQVIRSGTISGLYNLEELNIYPRNRGKLANNALAGLTSLTSIQLENIVSSNYVNTLSPLVSLKRLVLERLALSDITFLKQIPALYGLTEISLNYNQIRSFPADTFENYTQLNALDMVNNSISVITRFKSMNLASLNLQSNLITHIAEDTFRELPQLFYIDLSQNSISKVSSRTFEHMQKIKFIFISDNPLHCDCSSKWIYEVNEEYGIAFGSPLCATPSQHEGKFVETSSLYTDCMEELSYDCFNRTISCPVGSYCKGTRDSYECVCVGEGIGFSKLLNQCVDYESSIVDGTCCESFESNDKNQAVCVEP